MSSPVSASAGGRFPLPDSSPVSRFGLRPLLRSSRFPGTTASAARSATPVTRFAPLAWLVRSGPVARPVAPQPHRSARKPPGGMDHFPPGTASPREPGWFPHAVTTTADCHGDPAPFLTFRLMCAFRYFASLRPPNWQVKRYFRRHRLIRRLSQISPNLFRSSTFCTHVVHSYHVDS